MTQFRRYEHLERFGGHPEVAHIDEGTCYVFPKLDGTNASVWLDAAGELQCGSRNRVLAADADNHGFWKWAHSDDPRAVALRAWLKPGVIAYGEWLVPHTINGYRDDSWRRFWLFDVFDLAANRYQPWDTYGEIARAAGVDVVEPLCTITNPSAAQLFAQAETNTYLMQSGSGPGEGIVVKNYAWDHDGRQTWAKVVRTEFRESNARTFGIPAKEGERIIEVEIAEEFVTPTLVGKTRAKVVASVANHFGVDLTEPNAQRHVEQTKRGSVIPQLLGRVWNDFVVEEMWVVLKKFRNPTIDFARLNRAVEGRVKLLAADLFGGAVKADASPAPAAQ